MSQPGIYFATTELDDIIVSSNACRRETDTDGLFMKNDLEILDRIYENNENFMARASQELKRAQRYLTFVSYLMIESGDGIVDFDLEFRAKLRKHIRSSIRQTDIISGFNKGKLCILLVETGHEGAEIVGRRLEESIGMFLEKSEVGGPKRKITISKGCFPDNQASPNTILKKMKSAIN